MRVWLDYEDAWAIVQALEKYPRAIGLLGAEYLRPGLTRRLRAAVANSPNRPDTDPEAQDSHELRASVGARVRFPMP